MTQEDKRMDWVLSFNTMDERTKKLLRTAYGKENIRKMLETNDITPPQEMLQKALTFLKGNGHEITCKRCGGTGKYHYVTKYGDQCFDCSGHGKRVKVPTRRELDQLAKKYPNGWMNEMEVKNG